MRIGKKTKSVSTKNVPKFTDFKEAGIYTLKITVDPDNKIKETNESNNVYTRNFEVYPFPSDLDEYTPDNIRQFLDLYTKALNSFREGRFSEGLELCNQIKLKEISDGCYVIYSLQREQETGKFDAFICDKLSLMGKNELKNLDRSIC